MAELERIQKSHFPSSRIPQTRKSAGKHILQGKYLTILAPNTLENRDYLNNLSKAPQALECEMQFEVQCIGPIVKF